MRLFPIAVLAMTPVRAAGPDTRDGVRWFDGDAAKALEVATAENKMVVLDGWASWCKFCFEMDAKTWTNPDLALALEREAVPVRAEIDYRTGAGKTLGRRFGVEGLPAVLFIDPVQERVLVHLEGFQTAPQILEALDEARAQYESVHGEIGAADPGSRLIRDGRRALRKGDLRRAREIFIKAREFDPKCSKDVADDAAIGLADTAAAFLRTPETEHAAIEADAMKWLAWAAEACKSADKEHAIWDRRIEIARRSDDAAALGSLLSERSAAFADDLEYARHYASWALSEDTDIEGALKTAKRCVLAAPDDPRYLSLLAEAYIATGDDKAALETLEKAIAIDPQDSRLREMRLRLVLDMRN